MSKEQINETPPIETKGKQGRKPEALYFPRDSLEEALKVPRAIWENNAGNPFSLLDLSKKLNCSVTSSAYAELLRSSLRYGLTDGSWNSDTSKTVSLTALGSSIVAPTSSDDVNVSKRKALESPRIFKKIFDSLNGRIVLPEDVLKNTLIREGHISKSDAEYCYKAIIKNINELGLVQEDGKGKKYLQMDKLGTTQQLITLEQPTEQVGELPEREQIPQAITPPKPEEKQIPKQIFVAHGKNTKPLEQLEKILNRFKVTYKVAVEEPNSGRPVSTKVAELMKNCTSGIFIFTADERTQDAEGKEIWRPSDNVVYELGAASVLYGNKIVIFKESDVKFASDFSDLGYISFEKDKLDAKAADLMLELINLEFMQLTPT